jgi:hypothetical protein
MTFATGYSSDIIIKRANINPIPDQNPSGSIPPIEFRMYNQNGNYRRGYQRYIRGGAPKGLQRNDDDIQDFIHLATMPRGWSGQVEVLENEWRARVVEELGKVVIIHIPKDESQETTFEWDYEG